MAILSRRYRYLCILSPRTACTATAVALHEDNGGHGVWYPPKDIIDATGRVVVERKHTTLKDLRDHGLLSRRQARRLLKFCAVRNPFDSLVSLYQKLRHQYVPLLDDPHSFVHRKAGFVEDIHYVRDHSFSDWVMWRYAGADDGTPRQLYGPFTSGMDEVIRYEDGLQHEVNRILARVGAHPVEIPVLNVTEGRQSDYRAYYTPAARDFVGRVFAAELERFGYEF